MPINPGIALQTKPLQLDDPLDQFAKVAQVRNLISSGERQQQQMERNQLANEGARRQAAQQEMWTNSVLDARGDLRKGREIFSQRGGDPAIFMKVDKELNQAAESMARQDETKYRMAATKGTMIHDALAAVASLPPEQQQPVYDARTTHLEGLGILDPKQRRPYAGPEDVAQQLATATTYKQITEAATEKRAQAEAVRKQQDQERENKLAPFKQTEAEAAAALKLAESKGEKPEQPHEQAVREETARRNKETALQTTQRLAATLRGQNMTDARDRELAAATRDAAKQAREDKPATAAQNTVALYAERLAQSNKSLESINQGFGEHVYNKLAPHSALQTEKGQAFDQATRNWINAILRRESGAVISQSEFTEARKQYIPQPGDKPAALKQKEEHRKLVMESFKQSAGKAYSDPDTLVGKAGEKPIKAGGEKVKTWNPKTNKFE